MPEACDDSSGLGIVAFLAGVGFRVLGSLGFRILGVGVGVGAWGLGFRCC